MRKPRFESLRWRIVALVLVAGLPLFGFLLYRSIDDRRTVHQAIHRDALRLGQLVATEQLLVIRQAQTLLAQVADTPEARLETPAAACNRRMYELLEVYPVAANLGVILPGGKLHCSGMPWDPALDLSDRDYFRKAIERAETAVGEYQIGRITNRPSINVARPVYGPDKRLLAVVFIAVDLRWLNELLNRAAPPHEAFIALVDARGIILARYRADGKVFGTPLPEPEAGLFRATQRAPTPDPVRGSDGRRRIYAVFHPPSGSGVEDIYVLTGMPVDAPYAAATRQFGLDLALVVLTLLALAAGGWASAVWWVLRPVQAISASAQRVRQGDLKSRVGGNLGASELRELGRAFDTTINTLQRTDRALRSLSTCNQLLLRATDEKTLLFEMCGALVEIGGYWAALVSYRTDPPAEGLTVMAHAGGDDRFLAMTSVFFGGGSGMSVGPSGTALRTGKPVVINDFTTQTVPAHFRQAAATLGLRGVAVLPLRVEDCVIGVLSIYAMEPGAFDTAEFELIAQVADDVAHGIETLRARARHQQAQEALRESTLRDPVTGLYNRGGQRHVLAGLLSGGAAAVEPLAVLVLRIRHARQMFGVLSHTHADALLRAIAQRLREACGPDAVLARFSDDQFALLRTGVGVEAALVLARRLLGVLHEPFPVGGLALSVNMRAGIAVYPEHGATPDALLRTAVLAADDAVRRDQPYLLADTSRDTVANRFLTTATHLRRVLDGGRIQAAAQPKVHARTREVCGVELLARWPEDDPARLSPDQFIPVAEQTGLIRPLTEEMFRQALRWTHEHRGRHPALRLAVNVSAHSLHDPQFLMHMEEVLANDGAEAPPLDLELTESALMEDPEGALKTLVRLTELGMRLYIDDFGTGHSALSYLQRLPVYGVKIDKSFVLPLLGHADTQKIVQAIIALAHSLGLEVVAEGVEDQAVWDRLTELGCDVVQGYFICRPLPLLENLDGWLRQWDAMHQT